MREMPDDRHPSPNEEQPITDAMLTREHRNTDIADKIDRAFEQFDRCGFFSEDASRADMEARKAVWLAGHRA